MLPNRSLPGAELDAQIAGLADSPSSRNARWSFNAGESHVLDLYDQLAELQLEKSLLVSQLEIAKDRPEPSDEDVEHLLQDAERECLESRAAYLLKNGIVQNVLVANPLLTAVDSGPNASPAERGLHALVGQRDLLAMVQANLSGELQKISNSFTTLQTENIKATEKNRELTSILLALAAQLDDQKNNRGIEELQAGSKESRRKWRIMKSVTAAVIAGSGIDWAQDEQLRDIVLDDDA